MQHIAKTHLRPCLYHVSFYSAVARTDRHSDVHQRNVADTLGDRCSGDRHADVRVRCAERDANHRHHCHRARAVSPERPERCWWVSSFSSFSFHRFFCGL